MFAIICILFTKICLRFLLPLGIHCFESCNAIIFLVAISECKRYLHRQGRKAIFINVLPLPDDQKLYEDESVNRLTEALSLFGTICNSRWFIRTSIVRFKAECRCKERISRFILTWILGHSPDLVPQQGNLNFANLLFNAVSSHPIP